MIKEKISIICIIKNTQKPCKEISYNLKNDIL